MVVTRNSQPKTLKEIIDGGKDTYQQEYHVIITEIEKAKEMTALKGKNKGNKFTTQKLKVSDGTDAMYMEITPDAHSALFKIGDTLHLTGAYAKRLSVYWTLKTAQHPKGSCMKVADMGIEAVELTYEYEELKELYDEPEKEGAKTEVDLTQYKALIDQVFDSFWDKLVDTVTEKTAIEWYLLEENKAIQDNIELLREAGLMKPAEE